MCKPKPGAPSSQRVIVYTVDSPYSKEKPGFVTARNANQYSGDVEFSEDMWLAWAQERTSWERVLPGLKVRCKKQMFTHEAFVAFVKP